MAVDVSDHLQGCKHRATGESPVSRGRTGLEYDFDQIIGLRGNHLAKHDMMQSAMGVSSQDGLPMWVADMDFRPPQAVNDALQRAVDLGVHSYFGDDAEFKAAMAGWMATRHGWQVETDWIATGHGVVNLVCQSLQAYSAPGDGIILFTPVYHAFARVIITNNRRVIECPLVESGGFYEMDFDLLEKAAAGGARMIVLCSPHNPAGRVWTQSELRQLAEVAEKHDLIILSDEIHHDLVYPGQRHLPFPVAVPGSEHRVVVQSAPTKTFNIAGALIGNITIADPALRRRFTSIQDAAGFTYNRLSVLMATAAYREGSGWLDALLAYLDGNRQILQQGLATVPGVTSMPMQATYLAWADFRGTGMDDAEITRRLKSEARIAAHPGPMFGTGGSGFVRMNFATRRANVVEAVQRIQQAFSDLQ